MLMDFFIRLDSIQRVDPQWKSKLPLSLQLSTQMILFLIIRCKNIGIVRRQ